MDAITPFQPLKLLRHAPKVEAMLRGDLVYPISVELDLSNVCPHDCPFCSFGTSSSNGYRQQNWQTFPFPRILRLIDELVDCGVQSVTFTGGGEPLVHPKAGEIFAYVTELAQRWSQPIQWGLVTNGLLLDRYADIIARGATFVRVSLDAGTPETHAFTHGLPKGQLQYLKILQNIRALRDQSMDLTIGASFCVMDQNFKEIYKAAKDVKAAGANYLEVRPTFPTDWRGDGWGSALSDPDAAKVEVDHARLHVNSPTFQVIGMTERFDALASPQKKYGQCRIGPLMTVIGATGEVWHCCVQRGQAFFKLGSILETDFKTFWADLHAKRDASKIDVSQCPRCRYDGFNELIERAFVNDGMHANFV